MVRGILFLILVLAVVAVVWLSLRRLRPQPRSVIDLEATPVDDGAGEAARLPAPEPEDVPALTSGEIVRRLHELAFGVENLGEPAGEADARVMADVNKVLESVALDPRYAPRRPLLLPKLMQALNDTEVSRRELASLIARDPALTGNLLKLANSAIFRINTQPVESIDRAVALLGTDGIRSLVAAALVQPVFRISHSSFARFPEVEWEYSFRTGAAAEAHAAIVEDSDPFAAQLLGLMMGLGTIVVFRAALDQYRSISAAHPKAAVVAALIDTQAAAVAKRIAASWDLSGRILTALEEQSPFATTSEPTSLGRSLRFGRLMGALSVLYSAGVVDDDVARVSMLANGASRPQFDRIWMRLTGRQAGSVS